MSRFPDPGFPDDHVIRISHADAASAHVDDLLKRQASLRGERGISASRKRKWYYRNWFVFMVAGTLAALAAWGILEPYFNDLLYIQGKVQEIDINEVPTSRIDVGGMQYVELFGDFKALGRVRVGGQWVYLLSATKPIHAEDRQAVFDPDTLSMGDEIGLYVDVLEGAPGGVLALAVFVDTEASPGQGPTADLAHLAAQQTAAAMLLFPLVAAAIGLALGGADGLICRLWRRALLGGIVGLLIGFIGGFLSQFLAGLVYLPLNQLAMQQQVGGLGKLTTMGFLTQMSGRGLAWMLAGMAMGLGQGVALRSGRLFLYGFLGGAIGGLLGGLLFDPIDLLLLGVDKPSAHWSRLIGLCVIGAGVGVMIGVVELLARDAWLNMVKGPLAGKEFLIFKDLLHLGASPRSDIYLFNDDEVAERHAIIRAAADHYEIEAVDSMWPVLLNGRPVGRSRLRHGDQITLGQTVFSFHRRRTD